MITNICFAIRSPSGITVEGPQDRQCALLQAYFKAPYSESFIPILHHILCQEADYLHLVTKPSWPFLPDCMT